MRFDDTAGDIWRALPRVERDVVALARVDDRLDLEAGQRAAAHGVLQVVLVRGQRRVRARQCRGLHDGVRVRSPILQPGSRTARTRALVS